MLTPPKFLTFKPFVTSDVWEFKDPDTERILTATSRPRLVATILAYRQNNNLPEIPFLDHVIDNYLCSLPSNVSRCVPLESPRRSIMQTIRGGVALLYDIAYPEKAPPQVAKQRALQCVQCPNNLPPDPSLPLSQKLSDSLMVEATVGKEHLATIPPEVLASLGTCKVCTCPLKAKVFYNGKLNKFDDESLVQLKRVKCWMPPLSNQ